MSKILIGVVLIMAIIGYFLWSENSRLSALNQAFELRDQEQKLAIESLQNDFKTQTEGLLTIQSRNQEIESEMNRYLDIFKRHNLTKLAAAKPGLLEPKVNKGTKNVFNSIEEASRNIDEFLTRIEKEHGQVVFLAMSVPDYELMSYNMQELKRYINELKEVVIYYRKITVPTKEKK